MISSHGCAGVRGRLEKPLAALALALGLTGSAARLAPACHISHQDHAKASATASATTAAVSPKTPTPASTTPPPPTAHDLLKPLDARAKAEPQVIAASPSAAPATQAMLPGVPAAAPSVRDWHHFAASSCTPPTPPAAAAAQAVSPTAQAQGISPLKAPAVFLSPPIPAPAPEPSTILSALAMAGAFAWRRRSNRPRG